MIWRITTLCLCLLAVTIVIWAFDGTEYRQAIYGAPDHYCDATLSVSGGTGTGTGTLGDPWNLVRCMSEPVAGEVIGLLPVGAGTPVSLPAKQGTGDEAIPAFQPANSGTSGSPIVYVAKYAAITLDRATIATNQNRSELRTDGTKDADSVRGTGGATYGASTRNYIIYDGIFVDMSNSHMIGDSGVITARASTGAEFRNFVIKGESTDCDSNCELYRSNGDTDTVISNALIYDYDNVPTGGGLNQQGWVFVMYGAHNYLIEHFELDNTDNGIFPKGTSSSGTVFNYGTIRYGIVHGVRQCARFNDFHASSLTEVHHVLCYDYTEFGLGLTAETSSARNLLMHHVTATSAAQSAIYVKNTTASNVTIRDCLFDYNNVGSSVQGFYAKEDTNALPTVNYNGYYNNGNTVYWSWNSTENPTHFSTISSWRTAVSQEANSQVLSSNPFTNRASDDYTITGGHAALTASSTGGEVGAYEGTYVIGVDLSSEVSRRFTPRLNLIRSSLPQHTEELN